MRSVNRLSILTALSFRIALVAPVVLIVIEAPVAGCFKTPASPSISVPNGDFENWSDSADPGSWQTNNCPLCTQQIDRLQVLRDDDPYRGRYGAEFISNGAFPGRAMNSFPVLNHPSFLRFYIKSDLQAGDTASVRIIIFDHSAAVDSGQSLILSSISAYTEAIVPITHYSTQADSASILIQGPVKLISSNSIVKRAELLVDDLTLQ